MDTRKARKTGRLLLLIGLVIVIGLGSLGCVRGLAPIGWSGGAVSNGKLFVGARDGTLTAVSLADQSRQKSEALKGQPSSGLFGCSAVYGGGCSSASSTVALYGTPSFANGLVYIAGYNGKVYAYNVDNLAVRWNYPRDGYLDPIVGSAVTDGVLVYFGDTSGMVYALDSVTGDLVWSYQTGDKIWGTPTIVNGIIYIGSFDKKLYALNAADGTVKWTFEAGGSFIATPVVQNGIVYVGAFDRTFYALDASNGSKKWSYPAGNWFWSPAVIIGTTVYAPNLDGTIYALRMSDGSLVTSYDTNDTIPSGIALDGTTLIVAGESGAIYKIDTTTGQLTTLTTLDKVTIDGPVLIYEGGIYLQNSNFQLLRIDITSGAVITIPLAS